MQFANLIAYIAGRFAVQMDATDISMIDAMCDIEVPATTGNANPADVIELLRAMTDPSSYIPAIKAYRALTGEGLKDAKEAIERFRGMKLDVKTDVDTATLGDILASAIKK